MLQVPEQTIRRLGAVLAADLSGRLSNAQMTAGMID